VVILGKTHCYHLARECFNGLNSLSAQRIERCKNLPTTLICWSIWSY